MENNMNEMIEKLQKRIEELKKKEAGRRIVRGRIAGAAHAIHAKRFAIVKVMALVVLCGTGINLYAATITKPPAFTTGTIISSTAVNDNFTTLYNNDAAINTQLNGIVNSQWSAATGGINYAGGNVGIGTTNPGGTIGGQGLLDIGSATRSAYTLINIDAAANQQVGLNLQSAGTNCWYMYRPGGATDLRFFDGTNDRVTFLKGGNVGIGTTTPAARLEVNGLDDTALNSAIQNTRAKYPQLIFNATSGVTDAKLWRLIGRNTNDFEIQTLNDSYTGETTAMAITRNGTSISNVVFPNGNVGIGTTSPAGKLDVNGSIYQRGSLLHSDYVFSDDYDIDTIADHARFMWQKKRLPGLPESMKDENGLDIVEYGSYFRGLLEELEKAHVYIEQLHDRIEALEARVESLEEKY